MFRYKDLLVDLCRRVVGTEGVRVGVETGSGGGGDCDLDHQPVSLEGHARLKPTDSDVSHSIIEPAMRSWRDTPPISFAQP